MLVGRYSEGHPIRKISKYTLEAKKCVPQTKSYLE